MELAKELNRSFTRKIDATLSSLVFLDVVLTSVAFLAPRFWFQIFHGVPYADPQGLLRRCAANWAAFALFQGIALLRWKKQPHWLAIVAGIRFSDIFTDWTYLAFAHDVTLFGKVSLFASSPANLFFGLFLLRSYATAKRRS